MTVTAGNASVAAAPGRRLVSCYNRGLLDASSTGVNRITETAAKMLRLDENWRRWSGATEELRDGHSLGQAEILVKKLDAKELFPD